MNGNSPIKSKKSAWPGMILYPLFVYFGTCQIMNMVLPLFVQIEAVKRQGITSATGFFVLYMLFIRPRKNENGTITVDQFLDGHYRKPLFFVRITGQSVCGIAVAIVLMCCAGIAFNNVLSMIQFKELSESYQMVEQAFYSSELVWEILVLGIVTPIAEEVLYRYLIFTHLKKTQGAIGAVCCAALIFGIMHMNIVQAVYAAALGILLGALMAYYEDVRVPIAGHMAANVIVLLRSETSFLRFLSPEQKSYVPVTVALMVVIIIIAFMLLKKVGTGNCAKHA